jgi:3-deoxy-D-manno-octulosonate 8-phosphate phosphatase (KDO 8-P phosphatase)
MLINPPLTEPDLYNLAAPIKVLIMDVDGVLTDCKLYFFPDKDGNMVETKGFDAQDGIALQWARWNNIQTGVISGRNSPATVERARQVGMNWVFQGHIEKIPLIEQILSESGARKEEVAYIGDDLTDVVAFRRVGLSFATANARPEVRRSAHAVTDAPGGSGAVRDVIEVLLKARGAWEALLRKYEVTA